MARTALTPRISDQRVDQLPRLEQWWARLVHPETFAVSPSPSQQELLYVKSYALIRGAVGVIGIVLPSSFILAELFFLRQGIHVRSSVGAYTRKRGADFHRWSLDNRRPTSLVPGGSACRRVLDQLDSRRCTSRRGHVPDQPPERTPAHLGVRRYKPNSVRVRRHPDTALVHSNPDEARRELRGHYSLYVCGDLYSATGRDQLQLRLAGIGFQWADQARPPSRRTRRHHCRRDHPLRNFQAHRRGRASGVSTLYLVECVSVYSFAISWAIKAWQTWAHVKPPELSDPAAPSTDSPKPTAASSI